jgi:ATP-dependent RNA helicase DHX8/PRP22
VYGIYDGKITKITDFGCFVELEGFRNKVEGLVHISQIRQNRVTKVDEVVRRNQPVKVKVLSVVSQKLSLSMREVDQVFFNRIFCD